MINKLKQKMQNEIILMDGAIGTCLQKLNLTKEDFGLDEYFGCLEYLVISRPEMIKNIHKEFLKSGAKIIETHSFNSHFEYLEVYGLEDQVKHLNLVAAKIARESILEFQKESHQNLDHFVAGVIGPTYSQLNSNKENSFENLVAHYSEQVIGLVEGGVDYLLIETAQSLLNIKAAIIAIKKVGQILKRELDFSVSINLETNGQLLDGHSLNTVIKSLSGYPLLYLGINCSFSIEQLVPYINQLAEISPFPLALVPNAGKPDEKGVYIDNELVFTTQLVPFLKSKKVNLIGGCCGTTSQHIKALAKITQNELPRKLPLILKTLKVWEISARKEMNNCLKLFHNPFLEMKINLENNNQNALLKLCNKSCEHLNGLVLNQTDSPQLNEGQLRFLCENILTPFIFISENETLIKTYFSYYQGKGLVLGKDEKIKNSMEKTCLDFNHEMGFYKELELRELETFLIQRDENLIYGLKVTHIDNVFKLRSILKNSENYRNILFDITEVFNSFDLNMRRILTSYLMDDLKKINAHIILDLTFVRSIDYFSKNLSQAIEDFFLTQDLNNLKNILNLFNETLSDELIESEERFFENFKEIIIKAKKEKIEEMLDKYFIKFNKLGENFQAIMDGPFKEAMETVGLKYEKGEIILAEVLQSSETMKLAINYFTKKMGKNLNPKGTMLLASLEGDVHDIGKNLVEAILSNNGFNIINLGVQVKTQDLILAIEKYRPEFLGFSGLLLKSTEKIFESVEALAKHGIDIPILIGGAAISEKYVSLKLAKAYKGVIVYAKNAMDGLKLAKRVTNQNEILKLSEELVESRKTLAQKYGLENKHTLEKKIVYERSQNISVMQSIPLPQDFDRHVLKQNDYNILWSYLNPLMLYGRHLGIKGKLVRLLWPKLKEDELKNEPGGEKAIEIFHLVNDVRKEYEMAFKTKAIYQFFPVLSENNSVLIYSKDKKTLLDKILFSRQEKQSGLCISDYVLAKDQSASHFDNMAMFLVTCGENIPEIVKEIKAKGDYTKAFIIESLCLELAEAYAEYLHGKIRAIWGFPDKSDLTMMERYQGKYQGKRYSFGYAACPNINDQKKIFELLKPEADIGVKLSNQMMMIPESSISGLIFHHPECEYFSVGELEDLF